MKRVVIRDEIAGRATVLACLENYVGGRSVVLREICNVRRLRCTLRACLHARLLLRSV